MGIVFLATLVPRTVGAQTLPSTSDAAPNAAAPAAPTVAPAVPPVTLPPVHFVAADAPSLKEFTVREGDVDVLAAQAAVQDPAHPEDTALEKSIRAAAIDFLTTRRANDEPVWPDGLNPMVWIPRTLKGTGAWWQALRALPPANRPVFEGLPFLWEDGRIASSPGNSVTRTSSTAPTTPTNPVATPAVSPGNPAPKPIPPPTSASTGDAVPPPAELTTSERLNNFGLTALLEKGDINIAADLLGRAVTANKKNATAAYNGGILQMALHNRVEAVRLFVRTEQYAADNPGLDVRMIAYRTPTIALNNLLKKSDGSARRLYDESIDTAWALLNGGQYDLAAYVAGQGVVLDPDEQRCEAPLLIAMCYAKQGNKEKCVGYLIDALGRYQKVDSGHTELLSLVRQARGAGAFGK